MYKRHKKNDNLKQTYTDSCHTAVIAQNLNHLSIFIKPPAKSLHDSDLTFNRHVNPTDKSSFLQLRISFKLKHLSSPFDLERVIHALLTSSLDYNNFLYFSTSHATTSCLQQQQATNKTKSLCPCIPTMAPKLQNSSNCVNLSIVWPYLNFWPIKAPTDPLDLHTVVWRPSLAHPSVVAPQLWNDLWHVDDIRQVEPVSAFKNAP